MSLFTRLFGPPPSTPPRLRDVMERLDGVEADVAGLRKRVNKLQGLVTGGLRREEEAEVDPGTANDPRAYTGVPPNLRRKLRGF